MADGIDEVSEDLDLYDEKSLDGLKKGAKGFQNEPGFKIHRLAGYAIIPVVECSSDLHQTPQKRFVSPYELDQDEPELEVADRLACVRVHGRPVVGRTDDIAQVAKEQGRSFTSALSAKGIARALGWLAKLDTKLMELFS